MPSKFERLGIAFLYPDNWVLDDADAVAGRASVTVYSPSGAFWSVAVHPSADDPAHLAQGVVEVMREEYKEIELEEAHESVAGHEMIGYDLNFFYLDFVNAAQIRSLRTARRTYTIFCQGEDREFARLQQVFRAITTSLLSGLVE